MREIRNVYFNAKLKETVRVRGLSQMDGLLGMGSGVIKILSRLNILYIYTKMV